MLLEGMWNDCRVAQQIRKTKTEIKIYARFTVYRGRQKVEDHSLDSTISSIPYELGTLAVTSA